MKSNLWFDFSMANVLDPDGVAAESTFFRFHPALGVASVRTEYRKGELAFMAFHRQRALRVVSDRPGMLLTKVSRRLWNAAILLGRETDMVDSAFILDAPTQAYLMRRQLLVGSPGGCAWSSLDLDEDVVKEHLRGLAEPVRVRLLNDWRRARLAQAEKIRGWDSRLWGLAHALLPTLALLIGALSPAVRRQPCFRFAAALYLIYLAPFVLVSHYARYQLSAIGLAAFLISAVGIGAESSELMAAGSATLCRWPGPEDVRQESPTPDPRDGQPCCSGAARCCSPQSADPEAL
jgi:hypothetical protein